LVNSEFNEVITVSDDDEEAFETIPIPQLQRAYSDQKRLRNKEMRRVLFKVFEETADSCNFTQLIEAKKAREKKIMMDEIQERINSFNQQLQMPSVSDIDEDDLPDPGSLMQSMGSQHSISFSIGMP
jgi:hypothetical protein